MTNFSRKWIYICTWICIGSSLLLITACTIRNQIINSTLPHVNNPLTIRISNRIWLIDADKQEVVGHPLELDRIKELRGTYSGNVVATQRQKMYISNYSDQSETMVGSGVFTIDWISGEVKEINNIRAPNNLLLAPNNLLYVSGASNTILVIDPTQDKEISEIVCNDFGDNRSLSTTDNIIYATYAHGICVIDALDNKIIKQSPNIIETLYGSTILSNSKAYLLHFDSIKVVDPNTWQRLDVINLDGGNTQFIADTRNGKIYVTQCDAESKINLLTIIETSTDTISNRLNVGQQCDRISIGSNNMAYITNRGEFSISVIDIRTDKIIETIQLHSD